MDKRVLKTAAFLFTIRQRENEPLRDYMQRFIEAVHEVPHINHELLASIIQQNLLPGRFKESIAGKPPSTMEDLLMWSQKYIRIEEYNSFDPSPGVKRKGREEEKEPKKKEERKHVPPTGFTYYTPLNASRREILIVASPQPSSMHCLELEERGSPSPSSWKRWGGGGEASVLLPAREELDGREPRPPTQLEEAPPHLEAAAASSPHPPSHTVFASSHLPQRNSSYYSQQTKNENETQNE
ncbi:hypothetical protein Sango_0011500 [Sesamum angolense]|uniref:Retrotransposon gag domain-containing protein n=1 Tax=Sesamum angolense TaxID=2727404 RepID=A0AAE2C5H8_9LAMI|nr:hypothetical protein Sango_0011500 [Sesamum angolense]